MPRTLVESATMGHSTRLSFLRAEKWSPAKRGPIHTPDPVLVRQDTGFLFDCILAFELKSASSIPDGFNEWCIVCCVCRSFFFSRWCQFTAQYLCALLHSDHTYERARGWKGGRVERWKSKKRWTSDYLRRGHERGCCVHRSDFH